MRAPPTGAKTGMREAHVDEYPRLLHSVIDTTDARRLAEFVA